ncbi:MAG: hypothetical protein ACRD3W_05685, partial [Terriglobales bacterium]
WYIAASLLALSIGGNLLEFTTVEYAMGYNTGCAFLVNTSVGATLLALTAQSAVWRTALIMLSGMCACFCVFVKFPAAASVTAINLILIGAHDFRRLLRSVIAYVCGAALAPLLFFATVRDFASWWSDTTLCAHLELLSGNHNLPYLAQITFSSFAKHVRELAVLAAGAAALTGSFAIKNSRLKNKVLTILGFVLLIGFVGAEAHEYAVRGTVHSGIVYLPIVAVLYVGFATLISRLNAFPDGRARHPKGADAASRSRPASPLPAQRFRTDPADNTILRTVATLACLALVPVVISFGTNTPLFWHVIGHCGAALVAAAVAALLISRTRPRLALFPGAIIVITALVLFAQFWCGYVTAGHNRASLMAQTDLLAEPENLRGMYVEPGVRKFIMRSSRALKHNGFKSGDYILSLYDNPGLVWAVNGKSPGFAWFLDGNTKLLN